ncbi:MAG: short-chain dehydrogenase [Candidatus Nitrosopolaris wilkensis]|nr:MAG: short-chain dehydrogenase [Candidatus Nitrosopolaris wilkensis]
MNLRLRGKRAIVTGSSSGIGGGIAKTLANEGATVIVHGRNKTEATKVADRIIAEGGKAYVIAGDLIKDDSAEHIANEALQQLGGLDILINNAAAYVNRGWTEATANHWGELYNANVLSAVRMIRLFVPYMKKQNWGRIIQMASGEATQPFAFMPDYAATKAALVNLTVSLSKELANTGITVNTISPGIIVTPGVERFYREMATSKSWATENWDEIEKHVVREVLHNPVGRLGRVEEVANFVAYVASPLADYINGANLRIDGGSTAVIN